MIKNKVHFLLLGTVLFVISCLCGGTSSFAPTPMPTRAEVLPAVGDWVVKTDFGEIRFSVEPTGEISYWAFILDIEPCGTGQLDRSYSSHIYSPIQNNTFLVTYKGKTTVGSSKLRVEYILEGTFSSDYKSASGTWDYNFDYHTCSGNWQATR